MRYPSTVTLVTAHQYRTAQAARRRRLFQPFVKLRFAHTIPPLTQVEAHARLTQQSQSVKLRYHVVTIFRVDLHAPVLLSLAWAGRATATWPDWALRNMRVNLYLTSVPRRATCARDPRATVLTMPVGMTALVGTVLLIRAVLPVLPI